MSCYNPPSPIRIYRARYGLTDRSTKNTVRARSHSIFGSSTNVEAPVLSRAQPQLIYRVRVLVLR